MGSGLGVNISKNILQRLNHSIIIKSLFGEGTEIIITINDLTKKLENRVISEKKLKIKSQDSSFDDYDNDITIPIKDSFRNINFNSTESIVKLQYSKKLNPSSFFDSILVVDDSIPLRNSVVNVIKSYLSKQLLLNYNIIQCDDGIDMLKLIKDDQDTQTNKIKIIITDENMEYMSGSTAISIIKSIELNNKFKNVFFVSLTAYSDVSTINSILLKGADLVMEKPLNSLKIEEIFKRFTMKINK